MLDEARIAIVARPASPREEIAWDSWRRAWVVRVRARPVSGRANDAILRALAGWLDIAPADVRWLRAGKGPWKVAAVRGITSEEAARRLAVASQSSGATAP
jgi:uncharacterized protein YggU (UPF0235/DUF167 family)